MTINDLYIESVLYDTFFDLLSDETNYPLVHDFINENNVDILNDDYFLGNSSDKYISPLLDKLYKIFKDSTDSYELLSEKIASILYNRFSTKWNKIYNALLTEYNPLENYSMEEVRTPDLTIKENEKSKIDTKRETTASNSYKGFNAKDPALINKTDGEEDVSTSGSNLDNEKSTTHTGTETLTRAGNIGVTTSQQMLESEFKVRQYDFYKMIYADIDSILCLSIY
ncbi:MAG: hypothetical protein J6T10_27205 [Methanobrevibacter sp.]|nr:hypothetical protein [Methanobrevibacter sp.]